MQSLPTISTKNLVISNFITLINCLSIHLGSPVEGRDYEHRGKNRQKLQYLALGILMAFEKNGFPCQVPLVHQDSKSYQPIKKNCKNNGGCLSICSSHMMLGSAPRSKFVN